MAAARFQRIPAGFIELPQGFQGGDEVPLEDASRSIQAAMPYISPSHIGGCRCMSRQQEGQESSGFPLRPSWALLGSASALVLATCCAVVAINLIPGDALHRGDERSEGDLRLYGQKQPWAPAGPGPVAQGGAGPESQPQPRPETHHVKDFLGQISLEAGPKPDFATGDAVCNHSQPLTASNWAARGWDISVGDRIQCESRNRVNARWKGLRFEDWDRNWCWVGVKAMCHDNLKTPKSWSEYRRIAYKRGLSPSPELSPFDGLQNPEVCDGAVHGIPKPYFRDEAALALKWFHRNVKVYVLNLPKFYNRWDIITKRLHDLQIDATRVIGVDMMEPNAHSTAVQNGWIDPAFDMGRAQAKAFEPMNDMGHILGTVGCAAAHFKAQSQILKDNPPLAMVLEDDSWLMDNFVVNLWRIVTQELPCDWDVMQLLGRCAYGKCISEHLARIQPDNNEPADLCHQGVNWGFHGVLYRTKTLADVQALWKKRVFDPETPHCLDIDVALASISDKVNYYSVPNSQHPPLIKEMDLGSVRASINLGFRVQKK